MKRRRGRSSWGALCIVASTLAAVPALGGRDREVPTRPPLIVEAQCGDSLWTIAEEHADPNRDLREMVWRMQQASHVDPAALQPGDRVTIPADCLP